jgi:putative ABC transport system permease protein
MRTSDVFSLAYRTVRGNKLRSGITVLIIAFGIMALIGIITAIQAMSQKFTESFSTMGANGFNIRYKERNVHFGNNKSGLKVSKKGAKKKEKQSNIGKKIEMEQAENFIQQYYFPARAGLSITASRNSIINFESRKTTPNVSLFGGDENYLLLNGFEIGSGRNFVKPEIESAANVCLIGYDVAKRLFKTNISKAVNKVVRVDGKPYRVIGVLASRGSSFGFSRDNIVIGGYKNIKRNFNPGNSFLIGIMTDDLNQVNEAMGEAEGIFRSIRKVNITEESNFAIDRSDSIAETAMKSLGFLTISATVIGLITLIGAAIGLMNIMLVSVTERTKEVGLIKAIGGKSKTVRQQFLVEAVIISILGAILGIILGVGVGNLFSILLSIGFV